MGSIIIFKKLLKTNESISWLRLDKNDESI